MKAKDIILLARTAMTAPTQTEREHKAITVATLLIDGVDNGTLDLTDADTWKPGSTNSSSTIKHKNVHCNACGIEMRIGEPCEFVKGSKRPYHPQCAKESRKS